MATLVAVGDAGKLATSSDALTWTQQTSGVGANALYGLAWSPALSLFVATGTAGKLATSSDGVDWTQQTSGFGTDLVLCVEWSPALGLFAIGGQTGRLSTSPDGVTWTSRVSGFATNQYIRTLAWSPFLGLFVAAGEGGKVSTSSDGITWTATTPSAQVFYGLAWSPNVPLFVATSASGGILTSPDAVTWTARTSGFGTSAIQGVAWSPTLSLFVAVGDLGKLATSPDGITWTSRTSSFGTTKIWGIAWSPALSLFVASGFSGTIATSSDGTTWTQRTSGFSTSFILRVAETSVGIPTSNGNAPVSAASTSTATTVTTVTGSAPVLVGSSSAASVVGSSVVTGTAPVAAGSSSEASILSGGAVASTTGSAPVSVGSSSSVSTVGTLIATGSAPVSVTSSSVASSSIALIGWTADESQRTSLELDVTDGVLVVDPPLAVAPDGTGGPGPGGTGGPLVVERMLRRQSHIMPVPTPDADGHVRVSTAWTIIEADVGVLHVIVSGRDVTYFRDAPTHVDEWSAAEPFGDASAQVTFPQLTEYDDVGTGDLAWLKPGAPVEIFLLDVDGTTRHKRFAGHFISDETGSSQDDISNVWQAEGSLFQADHVGIQVPTILNPTDIGTLIRKAFNGVVSRRFGMPTNTLTGIPSRYRGSADDSPLDYAQVLLGTAWKDDGSNQWTVAKIPGSTRGYEVRLKDRTTEHHIVTAGAPGIEITLSEDLLSSLTAVFGHGIGPDGYAWSGMVYPKYLDDDAPPFPFTNPDAIITVGTTDADTDSGTGVSTWQRRVNELNLTPDVVVDGVFNTSDAAICLQIQKDYGLLEDGKPGGQTWAATFAVGSNGGDLTGAYRRPLAIDPRVEPNLYSASGAITGPNPLYDASIMRFDRPNEDFGTCTKAEATRSAKAELARDKTLGLTGSATLTTDPHGGSKWLIDEGHNIRINGFRGGNPLLHIADVKASPSGNSVTISLDEHARDAMTLASIRQNARDAAADPARRPGAANRRSRMEQDITVPFDGESEAGQIPRHAIHGGLWTVIRIPVSQVGRIAKIELTTQSPAAKFCVAFFGAEVTPAHLVSLVGDPLSGSDPFNKDPAQANALKALGIIEAFGGPGQAAGYWPRTEDKGAPLTGLFKDGGGMEYTSQLPPWVWVAEWSPVSTFIAGRVYPAPIQ